MHSPRRGHGTQVALTDGLEPSVLHKATRGIDELEIYQARAAVITVSKIPTRTIGFLPPAVCGADLDVARGGRAVIGPMEIFRDGVPKEGRPLNDFFSTASGGLTDRAGGECVKSTTGFLPPLEERLETGSGEGVSARDMDFPPSEIFRPADRLPTGAAFGDSTTDCFRKFSIHI